MTKAELVAKITDNVKISRKDATAVLDAFGKETMRAVKNGENVTLIGFGTFSKSERAAREGRNPQTGETIQIKAGTGMKFKAGKAVKDFLNA